MQYKVELILIFYSSFPQSEDLKRTWLLNMGRSDFKPSPFTCICSLHFEPECFSVTAKNKTLKKSALPTIFNQNFKNFLKRKQKRKKVTKAQPNKNFDLANEQESPEGIKFFKNAPSSPYRKCFAIPTAILAGCVFYVSVIVYLFSS